MNSLKLSRACTWNGSCNMSMTGIKIYHKILTLFQVKVVPNFPEANCTCKHQSFLQHFKLSSAGTCDPICLSIFLYHIK